MWIWKGVSKKKKKAKPCFVSRGVLFLSVVHNVTPELLSFGRRLIVGFVNSRKDWSQVFGTRGAKVVPSLPPSPACLGNFSVVTLRNVKEHEG